MKNTLIRMISLSLAASVIFTAYGCGGKENEKKAANNQPVVENNTAVVEFTSVNEDGSEVDVTNVVEIESDAVNNLSSGSSLGEILKDEEAKNDFVSDNDYGLDKDTAQDIADEAENWTEFSYSVYVANTFSKRIAMRYLKVTNTDDIKISTDLDCEHSFLPGYGRAIYIEGLVNSAKYETEEEIVAELNKMDVQVVYTLVDESADSSVDNWEEVTTAYIPLTFSVK